MEFNDCPSLYPEELLINYNMYSLLQRNTVKIYGGGGSGREKVAILLFLLTCISLALLLLHYFVTNQTKPQEQLHFLTFKGLLQFN
jgi:hypothetical protein